MQNRGREGFYARFLGGFSLYHREKEILIGIGLQSRPAQFLLLLLKAGDKGVERKEFLSLIRSSGKDQKKRLNNFYQHMHFLREMIPQMGLPQGTYIVLRKGRYYFTLDHTIETDTRYLDDLIERLKKEGMKEAERRELCLAYCQGYGGEFLPQAAGESWVTIEAAFYQRWYGRCLEDLSISLKKEGQYELLLELYTTASRLHPYDEWQVGQIECLMALGRDKEAGQIYEEAADLLYKGMKADPLDQVMAKYRKERRQPSFGAERLIGLEQDLSEENAGAPYHCSYPSFRDLYRIIARMGEREEAKGLLMLCTLREGLRTVDIDLAADGREGDDRTIDSMAAARKAAEQEMLRLRRVLEGGLRACDVYTRYSGCQYLALLIGAGTGDGGAIAGRLKKDWRIAGKGQRMALEIVVQEVESRDAEEVGDGERDICSTHR